MSDQTRMVFFNPYKGQLEQQVLSADPIELVAIVFGQLLAAVAEARRHLVAGDRPARSRSISRAFGLLGELGQSLNAAQGGDLARNLRRLYGFVGNRLAEAQSHELEQPLIDSIRTLEPLWQAWEELRQARAQEMNAPAPREFTGATMHLALQA